MNKLSIVLLLAVAVCSCYGASDRSNISVRSASEVSSRTNPVQAPTLTDVPQDSDVSETIHHIFTARAGNKKGGGHKNNKMELMHMGLSYIKMVLATFMSMVSHIFAFKSVGLTLIGVLIQIAQFVMTLKKHKESQPPPPVYKIVETPWHTQAPPEHYGPYGSYGSYAQTKSPYGMRKRR